MGLGVELNMGGGSPCLAGAKFHLIFLHIFGLKTLKKLGAFLDKQLFVQKTSAKRLT